MVAKRVFLLILILALLCAFGACRTEQEIETPVFKDLVWPVGSILPTAEDFVLSLPAGYQVSFLEAYSFPSADHYTLTLVVHNEKGKEVSRHNVTLTLVLDREPPRIVGAKDLQAYIGEGIAYRQGIALEDNCAGTVTLAVDSSLVQTNREGVYPVTYIATDAAGNVTSVTVSLYLYEQRVTLDMLWALVDPIITSRVPTSASIEAQVREVHAYVHYGILYTATSDKNDWIRAAYNGLKTGTGDCYTYFAVSKAFFERLGISNMDVERTSGIVLERHYWNFVNLGSDQAPAWYHFDACPVQGGIHDGCLLTDAQVGAYTRFRVYEDGSQNYFYAYDKTAYPASATRVITPTPLLEPYMEDR